MMYHSLFSFYIHVHMSHAYTGATATPGGFYGDGNLNQAMSGSFDCERDDQRLDMCGTDDVEDDGICDSSAAGVICQGRPHHTVQ